MTRKPNAATQLSVNPRMRIKDIKLGKSYRRDLGNIPELAESIRQVGLLRPVLITSDNRLIAGRRRLEACKLLGWETIQVSIIGE